MGAVRLSSSAGVLAALHEPPQGPPPVTGPRAAVVCHPHPLHGGTMDNKVVYTAAKALAAQGLHVLRFNFRGAGGSEGSHDDGRGEIEDARAALDLATTLAATPTDAADAPGGLLLAGFSFGSWVGLSAAAGDARVAALLAIAPPVNHYDYSELPAARLPLGVVYARDDELVPAEAVEAWIAGRARPPLTWVAEQGGHLFHGQQGVIRTAVAELLASLR